MDTSSPPATAPTVATASAPPTPMTVTALAAEPVLACEMPSLDMDPATGVDPVLYTGARSPTRFQRKPPHLDRAREYVAHGKSHLAARQTVAMLSERHRAREIEQEESFERAAGRDRFRARFVETRLATCGPPTLNTMDVRIARERQRNQQPTKAKAATTEAETEARVRDAVRRAYGSQELDLKALELVHIPPQVFTTLLLQLGRFITRVNVSRNALREIPEAFVRAFPQAAVLNYKENALDALPACLGALTGLEELHVECNQLRRLPVRLPATVRRLVAARNRLTTVPHVHALMHLVELDLGHNHLELLPPGMAYLSKLTKLVVSSNRLVSLALLPRFLIPETKTKKKKRNDSPEEAGSDESESDEGDDVATWTRERVDLEQKKWRVETDPLTGGAVYFHVARKRVARVKPKCFRVGLVPPLALGKPATAAKQRKTHAQWATLFPDGWEATLGGVCINRHASKGDSAAAGSSPGTTTETAGPPALQSLELVFTHHLTDETFTSSIPPALDKWGELHRLQALHIGGNQLVELPASIGQLEQLKLLDAEHNKLQTLPDSFHEMRALETVRLAMNALAWLPPSFCALPALTDLDLKLNRFEALPEEIGALVRLRVLDVSSNSLASLPRALLSLKKLATLRLQGNQALVTRGVLRPETLASGDIPQVCWHLSHQILVEQDHRGAWPPASESQIMGVGDEVWSTNHHVHRAFSQAIARAQQTGALDFHWKHLGAAQFPSGFFSSLRGLRELRLSGQALEVVPAAFANVCGALRVLQLRKNRIRVLEDGVFGDVEGNDDDPLPLEELDLEYNELRALPASVGRLTKLRTLRVSNNQLTQEGVPPAFAALTRLEELHATHNRFTAPPEAFGALVALGTLDLSNNQLTTLSSMAFAPLQRLRCLRASLNALTDLPEELARAPIEELYLAGNQLAELPATVLLLRDSLRVLRVQSNQISRLPLAFGELDALERVEAEGNPCRSPPPEILRLDIAAIRAYLRKRHARVLEIQRLLETVRLPFDAEAFTAPRLGKLLIRDEASVPADAAHAAPLAFLTETHLAAFERAVDAYVNGAFYLPPTASARGADLVTRLLLHTQFELAQRHRARVLRDFVKLCALVREKKWLDKVDFRFDLERPWGRLSEPCAVYAVNPRALYDDAPALPSVLSVVRKRVYHGFEDEAFDHAEATVRDALEHYVGEYGPVGVAHDDVPFKCGCEELLRYNKRHEPCFRAGWSVVQVVYTAEEAARRVADEEAIQRALAALRPQVESFLRTPEGEKRFHKEVKVIKTALRKDLQDKKKKLALLRAKHTKQTQQREKEAKRAATDKQPKKEKLTLAEVEERAEEEEKYKRLGERLAEATQEYSKGKAQLGQGYAAFLDDVVGLLLQKIGVEVRNHVVQQQRQKAIEFGMRRPWDGPNGRDFEAYKQLVRRRMLGDGSMEREDGGAADAGAPELAESDNSEISDVSFDGYEDMVSPLNAAAANDEDEEDDDDEDEDDDDEEEEQNEQARAAVLAQLEVSDVSDVSEDDGGAPSGKRADSEDSDL